MPLEHNATVSAVAFHPDGRSLATVCDDGLVRQWSLPVAWAGEPSDVTARVEALTGQRLNDRDEARLLPAATFSSRREQFDAEAPAAETADLLSHQESLALEQAAAGDPFAIEGLDRWIARRPGDWRPASASRPGPHRCGPL